MKYVNCPNCGSKLFEGEEGSHIILKCSRCNKLFEAYIDSAHVVVNLKIKQNVSEEKERKNI